MPDDVDRFLEGYAPDIRDLAQQVRALIASVAPDADESLKPGWKVIWYGFGTKMPEQFAVVMPTKNHVGLGFTHGTELPDPAGELHGVLGVHVVVDGAVDEQEAPVQVAGGVARGRLAVALLVARGQVHVALGVHGVVVAPVRDRPSRDPHGEAAAVGQRVGHHV